MRLDAEAGVVWPRTPNMPASFAALFDNGGELAEVPSGATVYGSWRLAVLPEDEAILPVGFARVGAGPHPLIRGCGKFWWRLRGCPDDTYRYMLFPKQHSRRSTRADGRHIDLEYGRIPHEILKAYNSVFNRIRVAGSILDRVESWADAHLPDNAVGIQVRTWRDDPRRQRKYHRPAVRRLEHMIEGLADDRSLFVVSDSDDVAPWIAGLAGKRRAVLEFPRTTRRADSWAGPEGIVEDLIDMLLLARTRTLFASYLSTFSETAWWLGGAQAEVRVF